MKRYRILSTILTVVLLSLCFAGIAPAEQRYYIAPVIYDAADDAWRSSLNGYINAAAGERFQEWHCDARHVSIALVTGSAATHTAIAADPNIITASPLFTDDAARIAGLNQTANIAAVKVRLEALGISTEWVTGQESYKDVLRYVMRNYWISQVANGAGDTHITALIAANLTAQVRDFPAATRTKINTWMANKGLATGWITNTTTVRQVVHFILTNLGIGKIKALDDEF